jgi:hypothetical protein
LEDAKRGTVSEPIFEAAMARRDNTERDGSWATAELLLDRGDPAFVDELRRIRDAARLGTFAAKWFADTRPQARQLLLEYLDRPLNAFRHEPLVKRLFKLAEQAGDDIVMARFLVLLDRAVRRTRRRRTRYDWNTRQSWAEEQIHVPPGTTMPRADGWWSARPDSADDLRLFSVHTRYYLRRRIWRYVRRVALENPARYLAAVVEALTRYTDADVADGLALLDNWGLVHILFHECPALVAMANGWTLARGHSLGELAPAPAYPAVWLASGAPLVDLLLRARCRPVRRWTIQILRRHHPEALASLPLAQLLALLAHEDAELAALAADALHRSPALASLTVDEWLRLLDTANPQTLHVLCELMIERIDPAAIALSQAVRLAVSRPVSVARLGLTWLRTKQPATLEECRLVLSLAEAEAEPVRADLVSWARSALSASPDFEAAWVLEFLDSRHADVREVAWTWFQEEPRARDDVAIWQRLLESPYDDLRLRLIAVLEEVVTRGKALPIDQGRLDAGLVRLLWASVLLNVHRGSRAKPFVVRQMVRRLERHPEEIARLLPILAVALRSVRGPEWRAGLAGVVQLAVRCPEAVPSIRDAFPELGLDDVGQALGAGSG